jgi:threonine/homoserine/homoserine lactone efflux protein
MYYSLGLASAAAFGGAAVLSGTGAVAEAARVLLDVAGGLCGAYLIFLSVVALGAHIMHAHRHTTGLPEPSPLLPSRRH